MIMRIRDVVEKRKPIKASIGYYPYIEIGDIDTITKDYQLKKKGSVPGAIIAYKGDILVSTVRPTRGAITVVKEEVSAVSSAFAVIKPDENHCVPRYLFYCLCSTPFLQCLGENSKGATYPTCSKADILNYEFNVTKLDSQRVIVDRLEAISKIIEKRQQELEAYDNLIKARFVELFGDDIAHTSITIGDISEDVTVGIANSATHAYAESGVVMLRNQNIRVNYLDDSDLIYIKPEFASKYENKKLRANDILVTRTGVNVGMACIVPEKYAGCQTFTTLILRLKNNIGVSPTFVCHYINSPFGKGFIDDKKVGGAQPNFGAKQLVTMPIAIPSEDKQRLFEDLVEQVDKSKVAVQKALNEAQLLFDSLMQKYFG